VCTAQRVGGWEGDCCDHSLPVCLAWKGHTGEKVLGEWQIADDNDILVERET